MDEERMTSYEAYDKLEEIRALLHDSQRKIYRKKLDNSALDIQISLSVELEERKTER